MSNGIYETTIRTCTYSRSEDPSSRIGKRVWGQAGGDDVDAKFMDKLGREMNLACTPQKDCFGEESFF